MMKENHATLLTSREQALQSREQRFLTKRQDAMYVAKSLVRSPAWWSLGETACKVLMIFLTKRQFEELKVDAKPGKREKAWLIKNNGTIIFTCSEAERYGITRGRFVRAIDQLIEVGFLDISHSGFGLHRDATLYSLSQRWKFYKTPDFVQAQRPRRGARLGFRKGNRHGRNC